MATLFNDRSQAEAIRNQNAMDDDDWTYLVEPAKRYHVQDKFMVGCYDDLGRFVGYL